MDYEQIYLDIVSGLLSVDSFVADMENHESYLEERYYQQGKDYGYDSGYDRGYDSGRDDGYEMASSDFGGRDL
ncbi:MAG: hypothetical protein ACXW1D_00010 [Halobacteriota archaeon]